MWILEVRWRLEVLRFGIKNLDNLDALKTRPVVDQRADIINAFEN